MPVIARSIIPSRPAGLVRLAGIRTLTEKTVDGGVVKGALSQAGAKFTIPNGLPTKEDGRRLIIENGPHEVNGFSGEIPAGYGKGTKTLLYHGPVVVKVAGKTSVQTADYHFHNADIAGPHYDLAVTGVPSQQFSMRPKQFEIHFAQGPLAGRRFSVVNTLFAEGAGGRMLVEMKPRTVTLDKPAMQLKDVSWLNQQGHDNFIAERKLDGSLLSCRIEHRRVHMKSHRTTSNAYYDKLPALELLNNRSRLLTCREIFPGPKLNGTEFLAEAVHPDGVSKVSGILNSSPDKAIRYQAEHGPVKGYVWDVVRYKGRDISHWDYARRRQIEEEMVTEIRRFNRNWNVIERCPDGVPFDLFYEYVITDPKGLPWSEGVVMKNKHNPNDFYKIKASDHHDLVVQRILPGEPGGKYENSMGRMLVLDPKTGGTGEIGSFAIPDAERQWIFDRHGLLEGAVAKVRVQQITSAGSPRAGVFEGFHPDKGSEEALAVLAARNLN